MRQPARSTRGRDPDRPLLRGQGGCRKPYRRASRFQLLNENAGSLRAPRVRRSTVVDRARSAAAPARDIDRLQGTQQQQGPGGMTTSRPAAGANHCLQPPGGKRQRVAGTRLWVDARRRAAGANSMRGERVPGCSFENSCPWRVPGKGRGTRWRTAAPQQTPASGGLHGGAHRSRPPSKQWRIVTGGAAPDSISPFERASRRGKRSSVRRRLRGPAPADQSMIHEQVLLTRGGVQRREDGPHREDGPAGLFRASRTPEERLRVLAPVTEARRQRIVSVPI